MKLRTVRHIIAEGVSGIKRNRLMTLASIGIVAASMLIFGIFFLLTVNFNSNARSIATQAQMEAFLFTNLSDEQVQQAEQQIAGMPDIQYRHVTREEAMERAKELLGDKKNLLEGLEGENPLPQSFIITLKSPENGEVIMSALYTLTDSNGAKLIEEVQYPYLTVRKLLNLTGIIRTVSIGLISMLALIAIFIISNTIKLTVFARRKEINIMKYIGATDWFIRWPFVIEGIFIGLAGSMISLLIVYYSYSYTVSIIPADIGILKMVQFTGLTGTMTGIYLFMGSVMGILGSTMAIRKHLNV